MSYWLHNSTGHFQMNIRDWPKILELAKMFGWQPAGTLAPQLRTFRPGLSEEKRAAYDRWQEESVNREPWDTTPMPSDPLTDDDWVPYEDYSDWNGEYDGN